MCWPEFKLARATQPPSHVSGMATACNNIETAKYKKQHRTCDVLDALPADELHLKLQRCIRRDGGRGTSSTIRVVSPAAHSAEQCKYNDMCPLPIGCTGRLLNKSACQQHCIRGDGWRGPAAPYA
jgi:hypothetical protein